MSAAFVLVTGTLLKPPSRLIAKSGKCYVAASLKTRDGEAVSFWKLLAFSETVQEDLLRLGEGEHLSAQGALRAEIYSPANGSEPRINFSCMVNAILAAKQPRKPKAKQPALAQADDRRAPSTAPDRAPPWEDEIPF
jgi:hypothetical protein